MARPNYNDIEHRPSDFELNMLEDERERKFIIFNIQRDLYNAAVGLGQSAAQARAKVDELFSVFAAEWALYALTGSAAINSAITNDATIAWLDTNVQGTPLRTRLINRLT